MTTIKHYGAEQWCAPCRALKPIIQSIVQRNPTVSYQYIDVDEHQQQARDMGIRSIPVVLIIKNGVETHRFVGIQPTHIYEQALL